MFQDVILSSAIYSTLMVEGHCFSFCLSFDTNKTHSSPFIKILTLMEQNIFHIGGNIYLLKILTHKSQSIYGLLACMGKSVRNVATVSCISHSKVVKSLETSRIFYCFNVMTCD